MTLEAVHDITVNISKRSRGQIRDLEGVRHDFEPVPQPAPPAFVRGHDQRVVPTCKGEKKQEFHLLFPRETRGTTYVVLPPFQIANCFEFF